ncbi:MAG: pantetheine-phosphate adenylyltransferase [Bdellovibrionaceae bacterium]|nr:pantetheine-phosphate adenylyltransferase [Pseudobdellovibrionaceae bacterium]
MSKIAVYPGSFDPITLGHVDIIQRISKLYDQTVVLISQSPNKSSFFTAEERKQLIEKSLSHLKNVTVEIHDGLTIDYMKKIKSNVIVRGLRAVVDFEYELTMANMNKMLAPNIETLLVFADPKYYFISSRGVKEVAQHGGSMHGLVPDLVAEALIKKLKRP